MADSPVTGGGSQIDDFRRHIGDTNHLLVQAELSCDDPAVTVALLEIQDNLLSTDISGGAAPELSIDLSAPDADTIERLALKIRATSTKYTIRLASDGEATHHSTDLEILPPTDIKGRFVQLKSRRWSDVELASLLTTALARLNRDLNQLYTIANLPSALKDMLFTLGTMNAYWDQVNKASKRRSVDLRIDDFRTLHQALLDDYDRSLKAYRELQPAVATSLTEEELDEMGSGEIIVGTQIRRNLRTGRLTPSTAIRYPAAETIVARALGSGKVRLDWSRSHSTAFHHYEIWRGTTSAVSNDSEIARPSGALVVTGTKITSVYEAERLLWVDGGTSPLPPGTYYYRLYVYNYNGLWSASEVVEVVVT